MDSYIADTRHLSYSNFRTANIRRVVFSACDQCMNDRCEGLKESRHRDDLFSHILPFLSLSLVGIIGYLLLGDLVGELLSPGWGSKGIHLFRLTPFKVEVTAIGILLILLGGAFTAVHYFRTRRSYVPEKLVEQLAKEHALSLYPDAFFISEKEYDYYNTL